MKYYIARTISAGFDETVMNVVNALKKEGFGVLSDIDVSSTLKQKLGIDFRRYRILGACNPTLAHKALTTEDKIGVMLPCNVIVYEVGPERMEVAAIDPRAAMERLGNPELVAIAEEVADRLKRAVDGVATGSHWVQTAIPWGLSTNQPDV